MICPRSVTISTERVTFREKSVMLIRNSVKFSTDRVELIGKRVTNIKIPGKIDQ